MTLPIFGNELEGTRCYVSNMKHAHDIGENGEMTVDYGVPMALDTELVASLAAATDGSYDQKVKIDDPYGRTITITSDAIGDVLIVGRDFLGQVMTQTVSCIVGVKASLKAFKFIDRIDSVDLDGNIVVKVGDGFGLPYTAAAPIRDIVDDIIGNGDPATFAISDQTDPASDVTGDVRGTYSPTLAALDGVEAVKVMFVFVNTRAGGLYGVRQA